MTRNIKLLIEYDGTHYCGWQEQADDRTVQGTLRKHLEELLEEKVVLYGAGRTDSGVHARSQVANFHTNSKIPDFAFAKALNRRIPLDMSILESVEVAEDFHAQFSAKAKVYCYQIFSRPSRPALNRNQVFWTWKKLDVSLMQEASRYLIGRHEFTSFQAANSPRSSNFRTVNNIDISQKNCYIYIDIEADGFLYKMVRNIVGTLYRVGEKKHPPEWIKEVLEARDRSAAGPTAPASGLCLEQVIY